MKNKLQITLLVSVPVTVTYDATCGLDEEQISNEVVQQIKACLMDNMVMFADDPDTEEVITVNEFSVRVNDIMPTNFKYN
jgi:hypothetical protein